MISTIFFILSVFLNRRLACVMSACPSGTLTVTTAGLAHMTTPSLMSGISYPSRSASYICIISAYSTKLRSAAVFRQKDCSTRIASILTSRWAWLCSTSFLDRVSAGFSSDFSCNETWRSRTGFVVVCDLVFVSAAGHGWMSTGRPRTDCVVEWTRVVGLVP